MRWVRLQKIYNPQYYKAIQCDTDYERFFGIIAVVKPASGCSCSLCNSVTVLFKSNWSDHYQSAIRKLFWTWCSDLVPTFATESNDHSKLYMVTCIKKIHFDHFTPDTMFGIYKNFMATNKGRLFRPLSRTDNTVYSKSHWGTAVTLQFNCHSACIQL